MIKGYIFGAAFALSILSLLARPAPLQAEPAPASLTVAEAVDAALRNNLSVKSASMQSRIKERESKFSFNKFYPSISTTATALTLNNVSPSLVAVTSGASGTVKPVYFTPDKKNISLGLTVQEVFSPVYIGLMYQASLDYQASVIGKVKAEGLIRAAVEKFYYQLLVQKEAINLTRSRLDNANERLRQAQVAYELGQGTELNYIYAKSNVETITPDLRTMETARKMALTQFQEMLGFDKRDDMELSGSLDDESIPSPDQLNSKGTRLDVSESELSLKQLKSALQLQIMTLLPNVIVQYTANPAINGPTMDTISNKDNWQDSSGAVSVTLSWTLSGFLPGSSYWNTHAELKDQMALATESEQTLAENAIHDEDNQKLLIQDSLDKIGNLTNVVADSKRIYELSDASYKAGVGRYLDLQSAELGLQDSEIQLLNERLKLMSLVYDFNAKYKPVN